MWPQRKAYSSPSSSVGMQNVSLPAWFT
jgi:hypothetical protein